MASVEPSTSCRRPCNGSMGWRRNGSRGWRRQERLPAKSNWWKRGNGSPGFFPPLPPITTISTDYHHFPRLPPFPPITTISTDYHHFHQASKVLCQIDFGR